MGVGVMDGLIYSDGSGGGGAVNAVWSESVAV